METNMVDMVYNGWENKPTWLVVLWIDNDEYTQHEAQRLVRPFSKGEYGQAGDAIKDWLEEMMDETDVMKSGSLWSDLLGWAFAMANWYHIGKNYLEEVEEDFGDEDDEGKVEE